MGRLFCVEFEDLNYYMCKNCRIHIAVPEDPDFMPLPGRYMDRFITVTNVEVENECRQLFYWIPEPHTVSDVYCIKCGEKLGLRIKRWTGTDRRVLGDDAVYFLGMGKLFWRNGDEIRDGETLILVGRPGAANGSIDLL